LIRQAVFILTGLQIGHGPGGQVPAAQNRDIAAVDTGAGILQLDARLKVKGGAGRERKTIETIQRLAGYGEILHEIGERGLKETCMVGIDLT
jgi:hypothetical protein